MPGTGSLAVSSKKQNNRQGGECPAFCFSDHAKRFGDQPVRFQLGFKVMHDGNQHHLIGLIRFAQPENFSLT